MLRIKILTVLTILGIAAGLGGCSCEAAPEEEIVQAGLSISRVSAIPRFSGYVNPISIKGVIPEPPNWKLESTGGDGTFCSEFCYLKQGILEAVRQNQEIDFLACLARKTNEANTEFDIPDPIDGCNYYEVTPPTLEGSEGGEVPSVMRIRLCKDGSTVKIHLCDGTTLEQEMIFVNNSSEESVTGSLFKTFDRPDGCQDRSKIAFTANCDPDAFENSACQATLQGTYCGCYGDGSIDYRVTGGEAPVIDIETNFAAGGLGAITSGDFDFCSIGDWTEAGGCFKSEASGSYPAIPAAEVPLSEIEGCGDLAGETGDLCPNSDFDPDAIDPVYPICPFEATADDSCALLFDNTSCCSVSGASIEELAGEKVDSSSFSSVLEEVSGRACPDAGNCDTITFEDAWDCEPEAGKTFTTIDLGTASGVDFSECETLLSDVNNFAAEENCGEQTADEGGEAITQEIDLLTSCVTGADCTEAGTVCHIIDDEGICVTEPASCDPSSSTCDTSDTCAYDPEFGHATCVPTIFCEAGCTAGEPCRVDTGLCESIECDPSADDCATKLWPSYTCNANMAICIP